MEEILIKAKIKGKLSKLLPLLSSLGYSKVDYKKDRITIEKLADNLRGKETTDYSIILKNDSITFRYELVEGSGKKKRNFEMIQIFMDLISVIGDCYLVEPAIIAKHTNALVRTAAANMDKDVLEVNSKLEEITGKYDELKKRYNDLVRSSEENARILMECERRRDELQSRVRALEKLSDEDLMQELYQWIKLHGGSIDVSEFCRAYRMTVQRTEEGLDMLVKGKFIRRRND